MSLIRRIHFDSFGDDRGHLIALEGNRNIPFEIKRVYYIFNTSADIRRGFHAHKKLEQVLICTSGTCNILLDDGKQKETVQLSHPSMGLFIGTMLWHEMYDFSVDCVLMSLASDYYNEADYIRHYNDFINELN